VFDEEEERNPAPVQRHLGDVVGPLAEMVAAHREANPAQLDPHGLCLGPLLGPGRIVASEIGAPNVLANPV